MVLKWVLLIEGPSSRPFDHPRNFVESSWTTFLSSWTLLEIDPAGVAVIVALSWV